MTDNTPAMTPEEWADLGSSRMGEVHIKGNDLVVWCGQSHHFGPANDDPYDMSRHAVAALALHGQPFGFRRADVAAIDFVLMNASFDDDGPLGEGWPSDKMADAIELLRGIRDRIAALLPP